MFIYFFGYFLLISLLTTKAFAVSCTELNLASTVITTPCVIDGILMFNAKGDEISRISFINAGDLTVSDTDLTVAPYTRASWSPEKNLKLFKNGRIILGTGSSIGPISYPHQSLDVQVNSIIRPVIDLQIMQFCAQQFLSYCCTCSEKNCSALDKITPTLTPTQ